METPDVPGALALLTPDATEGQPDLDQASHFLSKIELRRGDAPRMAHWRKRLFIAAAHITADYFGLPRHRTVVMGSHMTCRCDLLWSWTSVELLADEGVDSPPCR
jgi:KUP system potassium uptake protein